MVQLTHVYVQSAFVGFAGGFGPNPQTTLAMKAVTATRIINAM